MKNDVMIQAIDLTRKFKENTALDQVNLEIQQGELFGLVGPDGAGKTTLIRILAGLMGLTDGSVQVAGFDLAKKSESVKTQIGYMAQEFSLYGKLSVLENLQFFGELYDVPATIQRDRIPDLLEFAKLTEFEDRRASKLSGGMKKKLALACTLLHRPPLLLLDEPTTGVDPISRREFWNILTELHLGGTTIIVSTPYMDEADRCSRVALIYGGKVVQSDTPANIRSQLGSEVLKIITNDWQKARQIILPLPGVQEVQTYGEALHILVDSISLRSKIIKRTIIDNDLNISEMRAIAPRMEEAFISFIRRMDQGR